MGAARVGGQWDDILEEHGGREWIDQIVVGVVSRVDMLVGEVVGGVDQVVVVEGRVDNVVLDVGGAGGTAT